MTRSQVKYLPAPVPRPRQSALRIRCRSLPKAVLMRCCRRETAAAVASFGNFCPISAKLLIRCRSRRQRQPGNLRRTDPDLRDAVDTASRQTEIELWLALSTRLQENYQRMRRMASRLIQALLPPSSRRFNLERRRAAGLVHQIRTDLPTGSRSLQGRQTVNCVEIAQRGLRPANELFRLPWKGRSTIYPAPGFRHHGGSIGAIAIAETLTPMPACGAGSPNKMDLRHRRGG